ncbi:MAG: RNA-guided pseudouridylation complex pseudouridine synthase subunit Cbf5 [Candidatus Heimdallarchaeota archaeon]
MSGPLKPQSQISEQLVRTTAETNPEWGFVPTERPVQQLFNQGIINLDKPANPTSHEVVAWVKKILRLPKAGHSGTLDPKVTGVLPVALGRAAKAVRVLLTAPKGYVGILLLHGNSSDQLIKTIAAEFQGEIYQRPPVRSSVKRRLRTRKIYSLDVIEIEDRRVLFRVSCQAGTYIRKLCDDWGLILGVGGHMDELRRIRTGPFSEDTIVRLQDVADAAYYYFEEGDPAMLRRIIQPIEVAFAHLPSIVIRDTAVDAICHGAGLSVPGVVRMSRFSIGEQVVIKTLKGEAIALAKTTMKPQEILNRNSGICAMPIRVLLERGTYPRHF